MQPLKQKKIPERRCTGCGERKPKAELIRVVRSPEGNLFVDITGKKSGRGAYLCRKASCLQKAKKAKRLDSVLECTVSDEIYVALEAELERLCPRKPTDS